MTYHNTPSLSQINTERLLLRPFINEDAAAILFIRSNDIVNKYIDRPKSVSIEDAENFMRRIEKLSENNECFYRAIILKETNELIGTTCYFNFNKKKSSAEIGYELHPSYHGKGLMQEAITEMINIGFNIFKLKTIVALVFPDNIKSIELLRRNNFLQDEKNEFISKKDAGKLTPYFLQNVRLK